VNRTCPSYDQERRTMNAIGYFMPSRLRPLDPFNFAMVRWLLHFRIYYDDREPAVNPH